MLTTVSASAATSDSSMSREPATRSKAGRSTRRAASRPALPDRWPSRTGGPASWFSGSPSRRRSPTMNRARRRSRPGCPGFRPATSPSSDVGLAVRLVPPCRHGAGLRPTTSSRRSTFSERAGLRSRVANASTRRAGRGRRRRPGPPGRCLRRRHPGHHRGDCDTRWTSQKPFVSDGVRADDRLGARRRRTRCRRPRSTTSTPSAPDIQFCLADGPDPTATRTCRPATTRGPATGSGASPTSSAVVERA